MRKEIDREAELRREIAEIAAATAAFELVAKDRVARQGFTHLCHIMVYTF